MKKNIYSMLFGTLLFCNSGLAQIARPPAAAQQIWGLLQNGQLDENGTGMLLYQKNSTTVSLKYVNRICMLADYNKEGFHERDIDSLLRLNNNGVAWNEMLPTPDTPEGPKPIKKWMRADKLAVASLHSNRLIIRGNQKLLISIAEPPEQKQMAPIPLPTRLPAIGTRTKTALSMLGKPLDTQVHGNQAALIYPWGRVFISGGKVIGIE